MGKTEMIGAKLQRLLELEPIETRHRYTRRDTILYALGIGCGLVGADESELRFVLEDRLEAFPTMATVLAYPGFWFDRADLGLDWRRILLQAQYCVLDRPLPIEGDVVGMTKVTGARDRGEGKGALIAVERAIHCALGGHRLAVCTSLIALRGDGMEDSASGTLPPRLEPLDEGCALAEIAMPTFSGQPLLYRLSGDRNPVHADPEVARGAGFVRPIMHGLCTFGIAARALLLQDSRMLHGIAAMLVAPVMPGDSLVVGSYADQQGARRFRATVGGQPVLVSGRATFLST
jgi:acyl dehydratase